MYEFIDRPVTSLDPGGRFLIWSMRSWARSIGQRQCPASTIASAFARWKMIGGLQPFHRAMLILSRDALEPFRFHSLGCNRISEHEALLLSLIGSLGYQRPEQVRDTLAMIVEDDSVGDLLIALCGLATAMDGASILPGTSASLPGRPSNEP